MSNLQFKSSRKINSTWFSINVVNVKLTEHGRIHKIFHVTDIKKLLEKGNLEKYIFFNLGFTPCNAEQPLQDM